jgi:hypothetical protein
MGFLLSARAGGTLIEAIANAGGRLPERQVAIKVALPLISALKQLHTTGIVHRWVGFVALPPSSSSAASASCG